MIMQKRLIVLALFSLTLGSACLFAYLEKQNNLTQLRLHIPKLAQEIKSIEEENQRLRYQIQEFEQPDNLLRLASQPHFCHLKHPLDQELLVIQEQTPIIEADGDFFAAGAQ